MIPIVIVEPKGTIVGMNRAAVDMLGDCKGRMCWDAVGALNGDRTPVCRPGCTEELRRADRTTRVHVRGKEVQLLCTAAGPLNIVQLADPPTHHEIARSLSARETEVIAQLATGATAPEMALHLGIGVATVRTHLANARDKLGAKTQAHAIAIAITAGLLDD